ncbi:hypothetical protein BFp0023 (plasmid) [Bacteroides fragilis YCH46]|uniref:Uncharacterized protein n=1 Tax=Bacteroides fragilis (strain YCH46) TaxID=295405 RepID=Q64MD7_BACFR|nr:hypothetical protein BFp0023 [Bacteroides fragilis YCH46]
MFLNCSLFRTILFPKVLFGIKLRNWLVVANDFLVSKNLAAARPGFAKWYLKQGLYYQAIKKLIFRWVSLPNVSASSM